MPFALSVLLLSCAAHARRLGLPGLRGSLSLAPPHVKLTFAAAASSPASDALGECAVGDSGTIFADGVKSSSTWADVATPGDDTRFCTTHTNSELPLFHTPPRPVSNHTFTPDSTCQQLHPNILQTPQNCLYRHTAHLQLTFARRLSKSPPSRIWSVDNMAMRFRRTAWQ